MLETHGMLSFANNQHKWNDEESVEEVAQQIASFRPLQVLELKGNTLGVKAGERLATALEKQSTLQRCLWSDLFTGRLKNEIPPILRSLGSAMIRSGCNLTEIDLSDNAFGPIGADGISELLVSPACYKLETLKLNNNGLGAGGKKIAECLIGCYNNAKKDGCEFKLKRFIAGRNRLEDPGALALSEAFSLIQSLEEIRIPQNGIRANGIRALARAFEKNTNLKIIDINDNTCTAVGARAIAKAIRLLPHLEEIDLGDCLCRNDGSYHVVEAIGRLDREPLLTVTMTGNEITSETLDHIISYFTDESLSHVYLNISGNNAGSSFGYLREQSTDNIDLGESEDDEGTLDEEDEVNEEEDYDGEDYGEYESEQYADDASMEEAGDAKTHGDYDDVEIDDDIVTFAGRGMKLNSANDAEKFARVIEKKAVMKTLELIGNTIGVEAGDRLGRALAGHSELENCYWSDIFTGRLKTEIPQILTSLSKGLISSSCKLVELDLSDNAFGPVGSAGLEVLLSSATIQSLKVLKLNNNGLGSGGKTIASWLLQAFQKGGRKLQLRTFIAGRNRLENPGALAFAELFKEMKSLEHLELPQNGINKEGIEALAKGLAYNTNLRVLNLSDNTATEIGAVAIAKSLENWPKLEILDLGDLLCRSYGCHQIVDRLTPSKHKKLESVNLGGSEIGHATVRQLLNKWSKFSKSLSDPLLKLGGNNLGDFFQEMRDLIDEKDINVDMGLTDDDCGSLSGDEDDEKFSDDDDEGDSTEEDAEDSSQNQVDAISACMNKHEDALVIELVKVILELSKVVKGCSSEILEQAADKAAYAIKRFTTLSQARLMDSIIAQIDAGVKPEIKIHVDYDKATLGKILHRLAAIGVLDKSNHIINSFFPNF